MEVVIGGLITIVVTLLVEAYRRPKLRIEIVPPKVQHYQPGFPAQRLRVLRLRITNEPPRLRLIQRHAALRCQGEATFHHRDNGQNVFGRVMPLRWTDSPEPVAIQGTIQFLGQGPATLLLHDPVRMTLDSSRDVFPGQSELVDLTVRCDSDAECYGWNNETYFSTPKWRNPSWKLPADRYLVRVVIKSSGQERTAVFRLINDVAVNDFRLEPGQKADNSKLVS